MRKSAYYSPLQLEGCAGSRKVESFGGLSENAVEQWHGACFPTNVLVMRLP